MARAVERYVCQSCGAVAAKWAGRCDSCGEWNSILQESLDSGPPGSLAAAAPKPSLSTPRSSGRKQSGNVIDFAAMTGVRANLHRLKVNIPEFDRVCGGGLVPASVLLIGGDPGIGKSTLLLQVCADIARQGREAIYISGEEAIEQIQLRAARLGLADSEVKLAAETNIRTILATLSDSSEPPPAVVVIDSIQTMWSDTLSATPGTVSQVRASAQELIRLAKQRGCTIILVGHVTKDGQIAGPRVLEHMVDTVIYFEGERGDRFRLLRAVKNRFGPTDEIGVFEMSDGGLREVHNPSELFLDGRGTEVSGAAVFAGIEGTRPVLVEIQALVTPSPLGTPRRAVVGWDAGRLAMVLAVLDSRCNLGLASCDVYLNVAGGLKIKEPAADLAVAAALISSLADDPIPQDTVIFGEISLSGAIRQVAQTNARLKEAKKLGFTSAFLAATHKPDKSELNLRQFELLTEIVDELWKDKSRGIK